MLRIDTLIPRNRWGFRVFCQPLDRFSQIHFYEDRADRELRALNPPIHRFWIARNGRVLVEAEPIPF